MRLTQPDISHGSWTRERLAAMRTLYEEPLVLDTALRRRDTAGFIKRLVLVVLSAPISRPPVPNIYLGCYYPPITCSSPSGARQMPT
jgi:hypothetical protein